MMHFQKSPLQQAFTTIELALYIGLMSIVLLLVSRIFTQALDVSQESRTVSVVERDARYIDARLRYDMSRAQGITVPATAGTSGSQLQLQIGATTASYTVSSGVLYLDGVRINTPQTRVTSISFARIEGTDITPSVRVIYTIESVETRVGVGKEESTYQTSYALGTP